MHSPDPRPLPLIDGPAWPGVRAVVTTRAGGVSKPPYGSLNLGTHVGDDPAAVAENRARLRAALPGDPLWLEQVHGVHVVDADAWAGRGGHAVPRADAAFTRSPGRVLAIMTADCLPVVIAADDASVLAVAHAGWRGLVAGVLEQTVAHLDVARPAALRAWIGPAIGPGAFEVGEEVRQAFLRQDAQAGDAFAPASPAAGSAPKWMADLPALAELALRRTGVTVVEHSGLCSVAQSTQFFSYRRDGQTGRFATLAWLDGDV